VARISLESREAPTDEQLRELRGYFAGMPMSEVLSGLRFAERRWAAKDSGTLRVGRKSIIRGEVHSVTREQARWRLDNWPLMRAEYRRRGYSYPTISRIKRALSELRDG